MIQKLVYVDKEEEKKHEEKWGSFNMIPPEWKEVDEEKFIFYFNSAVISRIEYRQMYKKNEGGKNTELLQARLFFTFNEPHMALVPSKDHKTFRYFLFGCDHDWKFVQNLGKCYNRYKCSKCGKQWDIDSSD